MIHDPFYRQIIERLNGQLDPRVFQACANDLLRTVYPGLASMHGGSDAGMDGAIADGLGEPFPLIVTTESDVIGNLSGSLREYIRKGRKRRKLVLATSQSLTSRRVQNLYDRAEKLGFTLVNVHQQEDFANRLYRSPEWCRALLQLNGIPPALSVIPGTERPLLNIPLIGREADLEWLRQTQSDRLLVGQPGSGKTFLLHKLAMEGRGLFVVSTDRGEIASGIRSQQPAILIVDDAQNHRELLVTLRQMRAELGVDFSIVASCWPSDQKIITHALNLTSTNVYELELLTRKEIAEVIRAAGVRAPDRLIYEIVNQAEGRPGLAVTLALICIQGDVQAVVLGEALRGSLQGFFEALVGRRASDILAAFALGGNAGMNMRVVASALNLSEIDVKDAVSTLATGGVIIDLGSQWLSVRPPALRYTVVRDVFFGAMRLQIDPLLAQIFSRDETALVLIGAKARGAAIPPRMLFDLVEQAHSNEVWIAYSGLGRDETRWVLQYHSEQVTVIAYSALHHAPESTLPLLLQAAIGDQRQLHSTPEHPLRVIHDWVDAAYPGTEDVLKRRTIVLREVQNWLASQHNTEVGFRALKSVLSPEFEGQTNDPGDEDQFTLIYGYILRDEMLTVQNLWPEVLDLIRQYPDCDWKAVREMVEMWAYPGRRAVNIPEEVYDLMQSFAARMLQDILSIAQDSLGAVHWVRQIAKHLSLDIAVPLSREFETLYPLREDENWQEGERQQLHAVQELAAELSQHDSVEVVARITRVEREAQLGDARWPRWTPALWYEIAQRVTSPSQWIQALLDAEGNSEGISPFLYKAYTLADPAWIELAHQCLNRSQTKGATIALVLTMPSPPADLLEQVLSNLDGFATWVEVGCIRNEIPEHIVGRLLRHSDTTIACAAAEGEWNAEPKGEVRASLQADWRRVVIRYMTDNYWLVEFFKNDAALAYQWLQARLVDGLPYLLDQHAENAVKAAVSVLDIESRRRLLAEIPSRHGCEVLIVNLVEGHLDLYYEFLRNEQLREFHLVPLAGNPEDVWLDKAKLALEAGYSVEEVAQALYGYSGIISWRGKESEMRAKWVERFDKLSSHEDDRIRQIGEVGKAKAQAMLEKALNDERQEAVYGWQSRRVL